MVRAIIFDCFGVLTTDRWKVFVDSLPNDVDRQKLREINSIYDSAKMPLEEFLKKVEEITGKQPPQVEQLLDNEITKDTRLLLYIRSLKRRGYKIGLLSNIGSNWIEDHFLTADEQKIFDDMVFSFKVGMTKPDPEIYMLACKNLGVEPEQAVIVDDVDRYCMAAEELGMKAILYKDFEPFKQKLEPLLDISQ